MCSPQERAIDNLLRHAMRTDIAASHISQMCRAKANPTLDILKRLADVLDVSVIDLLSPIGDHPSPAP